MADEFNKDNTINETRHIASGGNVLCNNTEGFSNISDCRKINLKTSMNINPVTD